MCRHFNTVLPNVSRIRTGGLGWPDTCTADKGRPRADCYRWHFNLCRHIYNTYAMAQQKRTFFFKLGASKSATSSEQHRNVKFGISVSNIGQTHNSQSRAGTGGQEEKADFVWTEHRDTEELSKMPAMPVH